MEAFAVSLPSLLKSSYHRFPSHEHGTVSTYHFHYPKLQSTAKFRMPWFSLHLNLPSCSLISSSVFELRIFDYLSPCVYIHTKGSLSLFSLIWVVLPNLALQEFVNCKFIIIIIICKLKTISEFMIEAELVLFLNCKHIFFS